MLRPAKQHKRRCDGGFAAETRRTSALSKALKPKPKKKAKR